MRNEGQFSFLDLISKTEVLWSTKAPFIPIQLRTQWSEPENTQLFPASQGVVCDIKAAHISVD